MKNFFDDIYQAALEKDEKQLRILIALGVAIDEFKQGSYLLSAAGACAQAGLKDSAELLREHGANVEWIAQGAATGGLFKYAEKLCIEYGASINSIASGAAFGGYIEYAEKLRVENDVSVHDIAQCAAMGGHISYAEKLGRSHGALFSRIAQGAGFGDHKKLIEICCKQPNNNIIIEIANGAAVAGHVKYAEKLRMQYELDVDMIAFHAAIGGNIQYAEKLRTQHGASTNLIARGAATGGHQEYTEKLRTQDNANVNWIVIGAIIGGHIKYAETLYVKHGADINETARGPAFDRYVNNEKKLYYLLLKFEDRNCRNAVAAANKHKIYPMEIQQKLPDILQKANATSKIMNHYKLGISIAECISSRENNFERLAIWFLQVCTALNTQVKHQIPPEILQFISMFVTGLSAYHTNQLCKLFIDFRSKINEQIKLESYEPEAKRQRKSLHFS